MVDHDGRFSDETNFGWAPNADRTVEDAYRELRSLGENSPFCGWGFDVARPLLSAVDAGPGADSEMGHAAKSLGANAGMELAGAGIGKALGKMGKGFARAAEGASDLGPHKPAPDAVFRSFSQFKRKVGKAGVGMEPHHRAPPSNVKKFGATTIHNTGNLIRVDKATHSRISGWYSSKPNFADQGGTVRDWLSDKPADSQQDFGREVLVEFGVLQ